MKFFLKMIYEKYKYSFCYVLTFGEPRNQNLLFGMFSTLMIIMSGTFLSLILEGKSFILYFFPTLKYPFIVALSLIIIIYLKLLLFDLNKKNKVRKFISKNNHFKSDMEETLTSDNDKNISFNKNLIVEIKKNVIDLEIKKNKHFSILLYYLKVNYCPLDSDIDLILKLESIFDIKITPQYFSSVKNELEEIKRIKELNNLTRAQEKSYLLYQKIDESFNTYNDKYL